MRPAPASAAPLRSFPPGAAGGPPTHTPPQSDSKPSGIPVVGRWFGIALRCSLITEPKATRSWADGFVMGRITSRVCGLGFRSAAEPSRRAGAPRRRVPSLAYSHSPRRSIEARSEGSRRLRRGCTASYQRRAVGAKPCRTEGGPARSETDSPLRSCSVSTTTLRIQSRRFDLRRVSASGS